MVLSELFFLIYFFFRRQGVRTITFERQDESFRDIRQAWGMGHGQRKECIVFRPRANPRGPQPPKPYPSPKNNV